MVSLVSLISFGEGNRRGWRRAVKSSGNAVMRWRRAQARPAGALAGTGRACASSVGIGGLAGRPGRLACYLLPLHRSVRWQQKRGFSRTAACRGGAIACCLLWPVSCPDRRGKRMLGGSGPRVKRFSKTCKGCTALMHKEKSGAGGGRTAPPAPGLRVCEQAPRRGGRRRGPAGRCRAVATAKHSTRPWGLPRTPGRLSIANLPQPNRYAKEIDMKTVLILCRPRLG